MNTLHRNLALLIAASALHSCATASFDQRLDEKLAREPAIVTRKDLDAKTERLTANTPGLTPQQRQRLTALKAEVQSKLSENNRESLRLRSLLLKDVLSSGNNASEIQALEKRLRSLANNRVDTIFDAVNKTNDLLGRTELIRAAMDFQEMEDDAGIK